MLLIMWFKVVWNYLVCVCCFIRMFLLLGVVFVAAVVLVVVVVVVAAAAVVCVSLFTMRVATFCSAVKVYILNSSCHG